MRKKFVATLVLALLLLSGCDTQNDPYPFSNALEDVVKIELLHNRNENGIGTEEANICLIYSLAEEEFSAFMEELYAIETDRKMPPKWGYGDYIAKVSYSNGDVEMFGLLHIEYIPSERDENYLYGYGMYCFENREEFIRLLEKYCVLPEKV